MLKTLILAHLVIGSAAYANDPFYTVTCSAQLRNKSTGQIESLYDKTRSGPSFDYARDLAEENVMEVCTMDMVRFDLVATHTCEFLSCSQASSFAI